MSKFIRYNLGDKWLSRHGCVLEETLCAADPAGAMLA